MSTMERLKQIATLQRLNADGAPSASIAVIEDGKISAINITNGTQDTDTIYQACSISKAITALAVAKLVDEGRLSFDTLVAKHLPQSVVDCMVEPQTAHLIEHVTVRMLLSHTSGLSQHGFPGYASGIPSAEDILAGRAPSNTPKVRFNSFPGAQFSYSGGGYTVLQLFLEQVTGTSFSDLMMKTVLEPLDMKRSRYGPLKPDEKNYAKAHWTAYTGANAAYHDFVELAAAGLWTVPTDLLKAIAAIQTSLATDSGFLKQATAKELLTQTRNTGDNKDYCLGWGSDDSCFAHRGDNYPGYTSYAFGSHGGTVNADGDKKAKVPAGNGAVMMVNGVLGFDSIQKIGSALFWLKGWSRLESLPCHYGKDDYVPYAAPEGTPVDEDWVQWIGKWDGEWELVDEGGPALAFGSSKAMKLKVAAASVQQLEGDRKEIMFVVDGLNLALRLSWDEGERVVDLIQQEGRRLKRK